jgi:ATP/maltotriose-dependent transcriptional regulator MalT/DNA-binding SARP family transcriptional activator
VVSRPRIERLLAGAWGRRITLVVAGSGYGKTTALRQLAAARSTSWLALRASDRQLEALSSRIAEAIGAGSHPGIAVPASAIGASDRQALAEGQAGVICESLDSGQVELMLILDDADQLRDDDSATPFLRALCQQAPSRLHLVLSGRHLPALDLGAARGRGELLEVGAPDLAFTPEETEALLAARLGPEAQALAEECWSLTAGWAAALQLIADRLERLDPGQWGHAIAELRSRSSPLWRDFAAELVRGETASARRILALASIAPGIDRDLLGGLGMDGSGAELDSLQARGLLVVSGERGKLAASPVLAEGIAASAADPERQELRGRAVEWLEGAGRLDEALECTLGGPRASLLALVRRCGHRLVERGSGARVAEVLREFGTDGELELDMIRGEALMAVGDWDGAMELFRTIQARSGDAPLDPGTAWRFGALLYLRSELDSAFGVLSAGHTEGPGTSDDALVSAWLGATLWARGDVEAANRVAIVALRQAEASGDHAARAAAHVAISMAAASRGEPERNERHSRLALSAALQAGDSGLLARIHNNRSSKALEDGDYQRAVEEADAALATGAGHNVYATLAMSNKAQALIRNGALDEARALLMQSIDRFSSLGSLLMCAPYTLLAHIDAERGDYVRARMSFERGQRMAEDAADVHAIAQALSGLAWVLAQDDPDRARTHAADAVAHATVLERPEALNASAWVELCAANRGAAADLAGQAEALARRTGDRPSLARALELRGATAEPPDERLLDAAAVLWHEVGDPVAARRTELALAGCRGELDRIDSLRAELLGFGVKPEVGVAGFVLALRLGAAEVTITTLGRFSVARGGQPIPLAAWQSRKARDVLKLLAARRGRPVTRDAAAELLWPGEDAGPLSNRLSVALSTVRRVLDPERSHDPDYFIAADRHALSLRTDRVNLDVTRFMQAAEDGLGLVSRGDRTAAERRLREAESLYTGDFLEEDQYEDWTVDCREEARSAAQQVTRLLARAAVERGDEEEATRHLLRLLERDPYDADAWTALVGSQLRLRRFGEARRQHAAYARRMAELAISPVPLARTVDARP